MENKIITFFIYGIVVFSMGGCKAIQITPQGPDIVTTASRSEPKLSQFVLPLEVDMKPISSIIDNTFPKGVILSDFQRVGNSIEINYQLSRNKPVSLDVEGSDLKIKIPIDLKGQAKKTICFGFWHKGKCCSLLIPELFGSRPRCALKGVTVNEFGDIWTTIDVIMRVKLSVNPNFTFRRTGSVQAEITGSRNINGDLFGNLIRVSFRVEKLLNQSINTFINANGLVLLQEIDRVIGQFNLRKEVYSYWQESQQPIPIGDFWLAMQPKKVLFQNLYGEDGKLKFKIGLSAFLELVSNKPVPGQLPMGNMQIGNFEAGTFSIHLNNIIDLGYIEEQVSKEVVGKRFSVPKAWIKFDNIHIQGSSTPDTSMLYVKADVKGKASFRRFKGYFYFNATPIIDDEQKRVYAENIHLEARTNSFLINQKLASLVKDFSYTEIKDQLQYTYTKEYDLLYKLIDEELKEIVLNNLRIKGKLESLSIQDLYVGDQAIEFLLKATGKLESDIITN